ncbi:MAG: CidA/LrgA family protein [Pseudomonadota bacterium]
MHFLHGFLILCFLLWTGDLISEGLDLPIPGSVIGMVLLLAALFIKRDVPQSVGSAADDLIQYIGLLFVPAGAGISMYLALIAEEWLVIITASLGSTILTLAFCALVFRMLSKAETDAKE